MKSDLWRNNKETFCCATCMYFSEKTNLIGRCRRHAPTMSGYPVVYISDWCGDHKLTDISKED